MELKRDFFPAPKPEYKEKKPNRKKKKTEQFRGISIPERVVRGKIDKKNYNKAMEHYNNCCGECGNPYVEMHHITFKSALGRKGWRNLVPLCRMHHDACHEKFANKELRNLYSGWYAQKWRGVHEAKFGEWYYADRFDLWKEGLIHNCESKTFEKFMHKQQKERS